MNGGLPVETIERAGEDTVIDVEVTANRPDCLSVLGLAREIATAYQLPLNDKLSLAESPVGESERLSVVLEDVADIIADLEQALA